MGESWYDRHVLPRVLDFACGLRPFRRLRQQLVPQATGRVLEPGIGTGLNLAFYNPGQVERVTGVDPALRMHPLARRRAQASGLEVDLVGVSAERLPLPDHSHDTVVLTYTLCTIPDAVAALREMRRVLVPGGRLLFCEHGRAPDEGVRRWQRRLQPGWHCLAGGCQLGRDIPALLNEGGFTVRTMEAGYLAGPRPFTYTYRGMATAP